MNYIDELKTRSHEYGSLPFWSWNDKLEPDHLREQIRDMHKIGMNGFFMHARGGLETEYMSQEWYDAIKVCVDEADKLGMEAWSYDENGWPSGFAGGKLLDDPKNFALFLKCEVKDSFDPEALAVYVVENNKSRRVTAPEADPGTKYTTIYRKADPTYVDTLSREVIAKFIRSTHEEYKKELGADFGGKMPGFFTDEPQYFRYATVWSDTLPEKFSERYGYDIFSALDAMFVDFDGAPEFRYDYWHLTHDLFIDAFVKQIYEWCEANGCKLTGHAVEETFLAGQMWCCGGVMPFYEYEHIPGIDHLGRGYDQGLAAKQLGSVAAQLGKKKVLSEMFGCCGWDVSPQELKKITESQYVAGINIMCQHLYPYSERGQRKRDYPAHYSEHLPWHAELAGFNEYYNRLGYTLAQGKEIAPVLVLHPIHSCWLNYKREVDGPSVAELDGSVRQVIASLYDRHIAFHFGDEDIMARHATVENGKLRIGEIEYSAVVLPKIYSLDPSTVKILKEYSAQGGRFLLADGMPDRINGRVVPAEELAFLKDNVTLDVLEQESEFTVSTRVHDVRSMVRTTSRGRIAYIVNLTSEKLEAVRIGFKGAKHLNLLDVERGVFRKAPWQAAITRPDGTEYLTASVDLESGESVILTEFEGEDEKEAINIGEPMVFTKPFTAVSRPENALTLDRVSVSFDGQNFDAPKPLELVRDQLYRKRYAGKLWLRYSFELQNVPENLNFAIEPMNLEEICCNGTPVNADKGSWFDFKFLSGSLKGLLHPGANDITARINYFQRDYVYYVLYGGVSESLRNCLVFDTEIEDIYLFGDFEVVTDNAAFTEGPRNSLEYTGTFALRAPEGSLKMDDFVRSGYPFFAGSATFETEYEYDGQSDATELVLGGRFAVAEISVNGQPAGSMFFKHHLDLSAFLKPGKNTVTVRLLSSNRNLMGPHHFADPEPYALGPVQFSFEGHFNEEGQCGFFTPRYAFVKFGAEPIK